MYLGVGAHLPNAPPWVCQRIEPISAVKVSLQDIPQQNTIRIFVTLNLTSSWNTGETDV